MANDDDGLSAARGFLNGICYGLALWLLVTLLVMWA